MIMKHNLDNPRIKLRYKDLDGTNQSISTPALRLREEQCTTGTVGLNNNKGTGKLNCIL